jgi:signal transduction histidine kinase
METKDPEITKYVHLQQQSGQRLLNTITSILELSRIEASRHELTLKVVEINPLVKECVEPLEQLALSKRLDFRFQPSPQDFKSLSDETILFQVINNVVGNAIKFTEKGGVVVTTELDTEKPTMMAITVKDTGVGISPDFFNKIFTPFAQESTGRSRSHEGTGLGLSISKRYIELLGGSIRVQSVKGSGSTFQIVLPVYV